MSQTLPRLMSVDECAAYIGRTRAAVYKLVHRRQIPFVRPGKRGIQFDRREIDQWITDATVKAAR